MPPNALLDRNGESPLLGSDFLKSAFPALNFFFPNELRELYRKVVQTENQPILETLLEEMKISLHVDSADLVRIPANGAAIVVANHPFGILDGIVLGALALRVRPDVKILTNYLLTIPELEPYCIFVDPFNRKHSKQNNSAGLKQAIYHLRAGGMLIVFPAGEVSHWQFKHGEISDPQWSDTTSRLVRFTGSSVVPVLFTGTNSLPFHILGLIHPILRTARLPHELLNKTGKTVEVRVGTPIPAKRICEIADDRQATDFLRWRTYLLAHRGDSKSHSPMHFRFPAAFRKTHPVAPALQQRSLLTELQTLGEERILCVNRDFSVYAAQGHEIPNLLAEIGRQREITFREAGEGTGKALDLDEFDSYYTHLILWSKQNQELAGAYRLVNTQEVLDRRGIRGLYTSSLFAYDPRLFAEMGPALELGRSFVCGLYQKQYASLLMLWKGIAAYVGRYPQTPILFGAVSMSSSYSRASLELVTRFFQSKDSNPLASFVKPKRSLRATRRLPDWELSAIKNLLGLDELSSSVAEIEKDGKGVPILLKQYVKVGGTVLAFNVDKNFSDVLDGLIVVDLRKTDPARLEPYMSKQSLANFHQFHGLTLPSTD
jgi:putative hemolysin